MNLAGWMSVGGGMGGYRTPTDPLQAKLPFTKDGAKFAARKVGMTSMLRYITMHRALQATPSLLTYSARLPLGSIVEGAAIQPDEPVKYRSILPMAVAKMAGYHYEYLHTCTYV